MARLVSARLKLERADFHYAALTAAVAEFLEPLPPPDEALDDAGLRVFSVPDDAPDPPAAIALILGDFVQNLRSSLDHAVHELAASPGNKSTEFPIYRSRREFDGKRQRKIGLLSPHARQYIEDVQAFAPHPPNVGWRLHDLATIDRHRAIPLLRTYFRSSRVQIPEDGRMPLIADGIIGAARPGTVLSRLPNSPSYKLEFEVQVRSDRGPGYADQDLLVVARLLADKCGDVVTALEGFVS